MVTSKRKTAQETDIDYSASIAKPVQERNNITFNDDLMMMRSYVDHSQAAPSEPVYKEKVEKPAAIVEAPAPAKKPVRVADFMPTIAAKREKAVEKETVRETDITVRREKALSPSMKKALIAYLSVVLILTIAVIVTGVAISSVSAQIADSESMASELTTTIALQNAELESLSDPVVLSQIAETLGMTEVTSSVTAPLVAVRDIEETSDTNWFNNFCKWISSIFGG